MLVQLAMTHKIRQQGLFLHQPNVDKIKTANSWKSWEIYWLVNNQKCVGVKCGGDRQCLEEEPKVFQVEPFNILIFNILITLIFNILISLTISSSSPKATKLSPSTGQHSFRDFSFGNTIKSAWIGFHLEQADKSINPRFLASLRVVEKLVNHSFTRTR